MALRWLVKEVVTEDFIKRFPELNRVTLQLLYNRELKDEKAMNDFLYPDYESHLLDPFLFKDMEKAVKKFFSVLTGGGKIHIYGDYDADGVCSSAVLYKAIKAFGADPEVYIPFRETEGYGLNMAVAKRIIDQKVALLITVDCGISNKDEIAYLKDHGVEVIVLDHHQEPLELPPAYAIINPAVKSCGYPFPYLCGAGVVFKFVQALIMRQEKLSPIKLPAGFEKWLLDLVAIATIGDIVILHKENRIFAYYGLKVLEKTRHLGLKKIIDKINNHSGRIDSQYVGWRIVPRLNAAGRINHASAAFNLLKSLDDEEAEKDANKLEENNKKRQQITENVQKQAFAQVEAEAEKAKILFAVGENWLAGVVGLVAGRISDKYNRPALVFSKEGEKYVGSGRSIPVFNITEALKENAGLLSRYGGHSQACGLTIIGDDNFKKFKNKMERLTEKKLKNIDLDPALNIETEVKLLEINWDLWDDLSRFEPFGEGNLKPLFAARQLRIENVQTVGNDGKHLKVQVSQDDNLKHIHKLIGFSFGDWCAKLDIGDLIDIVFELDINEWNGNRELQLKIVDLKLSE